MKRIVFALMCLFASGSAAAQTYACQFIMTAGMDKDPKSGWISAFFKVPEPFFLTMSNGSIDPKSFAEPPVHISQIANTCMKYDFPGGKGLQGVIHWCADQSTYLSFSENTLSGGVAQITGALQPSTDAKVDSVTVSRFKCQKVR